jgi:hypothetical protein
MTKPKPSIRVTHSGHKHFIKPNRIGENMLKEKDKETVIFHIRKPFKKQRGNQFYYDYSDRGQGNYCGSPETEFDVPHKSVAREWSKLQTHYVPCEQCCFISAFGKN